MGRGVRCRSKPGLTFRNRKVLGVLEDVANQLSFIKTVADAEVEEKLR